MNIAINLIALFALLFWPFALFISAMGFASPESSNNSSALLTTILILCYPIYIFSLMSIFSHTFFGLKTHYLLALSTVIIFYGLYSFGYLRMYKNTLNNIDNSGVTITETSVFVMGRRANEADPKSFKVISDFGGGQYYKDHKQVYFRNKVLIDANPDTFDMLEHPEWGKTGHNFTKDDKRVFYFNEIIKGADVESFKVIDNLNAKDKNHTYQGSYKLK